MTADHDWREIAIDQGHRLLRLRVALHVLRAWGSVAEARSPGVTTTIHRWIDAGMEGPVPWPDDASFAAWAARNGLGRVGDHIGSWFSTPASGVSH